MWNIIWLHRAWLHSPDMIIFPKLLVDQKRGQGQFADDTPMVIEVSPWEFLMPALSHMGSTST